MEKSIANQTIALAGLAQATTLVNQLATRGQCDPVAYESSIRSVLKLDAKDISDVYGNLSDLNYGFIQLRKILQAQSDDVRQPTRYATMLMVLESKFMKNNQLQDNLRKSLLRASEQANFFSPTHENVVAHMASIYQETISGLSPRIMIQGDRTFLNNQEHANKIRALLLAGIRSVVLWEQSGGKRWKLIFNRRKILSQLNQFLAT